jgi:Tol biopolymer transport system component
VKEMNRTFFGILAAGVVISLSAAPQKDASAAAQMQAAVNKQTVEGDLNGAIKQYAAIIAKYGKTDRSVAASALVHMAECHQAMGDAEAHAIYERIVRDYADQKDAAAKARARLSAVRKIPGGVSVHQVWACSPEIYCAERVSPNGRYLAFTSGTVSGDVAVCDLATGENRRLTHHGPTTTETDDLVWSPDSKRLAYDWADYKEIRIINADGTGERTVLRTEVADEWIGPADWSPDGKRILINRGKKNNDPSLRIEWLDAADGRTTLIKTVPRGGAEWVSPDGRYIAFANREAPAKPQQVHLMSSDGSGGTILSAHPAGEYPVGWSPDGGHVLFISLRGNAPGLWAVPVANGKAQGPARVLKTVLANGNQVLSLGVTRGGAFYYSSNVSGSDIYTASLDPATGKATSSPVVLSLSRTGHNVFPIWSPDGRRLLTSWVESLAGANSFREMSIFSLDTSKEQRLLQIETGVGRCWSPDGASILAGPPLTRINIATGEKKITEGPNFSSCSAKGTAVAFADPAFKFVGVKDLETGSEKELYRAASNARVGFVVQISPDGSQVAFTTNEGKENHLNVYAASSLMIAPTSGGPARELVRVTPPERVSDNMEALAWSPDSRYIYFAKRPSRWGVSELFRVPAAGGEAASTGLKMMGMQGLSISPDGTRMAFSTGAAPNWQVWAIENFLAALK